MNDDQNQNLTDDTDSDDLEDAGQKEGSMPEDDIPAENVDPTSAPNSEDPDGP